ncbi:zinc finger C4H2 domain-containing protein-like, partial [Tropilaelaps mercedesae]
AFRLSCSLLFTLTAQVIKQAQEERNQHLEVAKQLHHELRPLKDLVDRLRSEIGLAKLPELHQEEPLIKPEFFERQRFDTQPISHHDMGAAPQVLPVVPSDNPLLQQHQQQLASAVQQMRQRGGVGAALPGMGAGAGSMAVGETHQFALCVKLSHVLAIRRNPKGRWKTKPDLRNPNTQDFVPPPSRGEGREGGYINVVVFRGKAIEPTSEGRPGCGRPS